MPAVTSAVVPPPGQSAMKRVSYFGQMNYRRLARMLSDHDLYWSRHNQCGESVVRCCSFLQFCCVSLFSMVTLLTPWMLSAAELVIMLTLYFTVAPESVESIKNSSGNPEHNLSSKRFRDVLVCSIVRVTLLSVSYAFAFKKHQPYYCIAWLTSLALIPYGIVKAAVIELDPVGPALSLILTLILFSIVHVIVAHASVKRMQKKMNMGLSSFDVGWDDEWVMNESQNSYSTSDVMQDLLSSRDDDIPRESLKDADSKFVDCDGVSVHYKEELPDPAEDVPHLDPAFAVLLIHGFGGGVFAWRHVMRPLAVACRCRVVAFDRPAFGLTDRPKVETVNNPYSLHFQQRLVLQLCQKLGIKKVMVVGHSDGCILALMLGAALNPLSTSFPSRVSEKTRKLLKTGSVPKREGEHVVIGMSIRRSLTGSLESDLPNVPENADLESGAQPPLDALLRPMAHVDVSILTMVLLHPDLSREEGLSFTSLLRQSKIGRKVLRPLLRSDIGEVSSRRAWHDTSKLTKEILELYKAPLRIHGWDSALVAYTRERRLITSDLMRQSMQRVVGLPLLVVTGEKDRIVPPEKADEIAEELHAEHRQIISNCGHLSHEEVPEALMVTLVAYVNHTCELYPDL